MAGGWQEADSGAGHAALMGVAASRKRCGQPGQEGQSSARNDLGCPCPLKPAAMHRKRRQRRKPAARAATSCAMHLCPVLQRILRQRCCTQLEAPHALHAAAQDAQAGGAAQGRGLKRWAGQAGLAYTFDTHLRSRAGSVQAPQGRAGQEHQWRPAGRAAPGGRPIHGAASSDEQATAPRT